jgi:predicted GIY-YIG superfamily endonuclease
MKRNRTEYNKRYNEENREKIAARKKAYREANKERLAADKKSYYESKKDGLYTVYLLPEENYVGMTNNLYRRLEHHKSKHKRDVSDVKILGKYHTKDEALVTEARYHNEGYKGRNWGEFQHRVENYNKPEAVARRKEIEQELLLIGKKFNLI